ncbi:MAG: hypothetical protein RR505_08545, partial [Raoultibacter sp.]
MNQRIVPITKETALIVHQRKIKEYGGIEGVRDEALPRLLSLSLGKASITLSFTQQPQKRQPVLDMKSSANIPLLMATKGLE